MSQYSVVVIVFHSWYREKFSFLKPEAPIKCCNDTQCDERREKSHSAYFTVFAQVMDCYLLPCTVISAHLTLSWGLNWKKTTCFYLTESAH